MEQLLYKSTVDSQVSLTRHQTCGSVDHQMLSMTDHGQSLSL